MAPRKMKQQATKDLKARLKVKRVRVEMGKIRKDQQCIREGQIKTGERFVEIERQCHELKEETEIIAKQSARTHIKLALMFKILKAREGGDFVEAAKLTHFLREFVSKEKANASSQSSKMNIDSEKELARTENSSLCSICRAETVDHMRGS